MSTWSPPPERKSQVKRAGKRIADGLGSEADFDLVDQWRSSHGYVINTFQAKCASLGEMPKAHPLVPRYAQKGIRRRVHGNYQIFYRADDTEIVVIRVLHGARDHTALLFPQEEPQ